MSDSSDPSTPAPVPGAEPALREAIRAILEPLARLAVARGLPYPVVEEMLKESFVRSAHAAHTSLPEHRRVSRVSAATGINRREVTRLLNVGEREAVPVRSYPTEVFAQWTTHAEYLDAARRPRTLPRLGPAPSFESLAHSVTRDMHPRSLLEELLRLGLAAHDEDTDTVSLAAESFVPSRDRQRMDAFLGANVGDHLRGAVANVLGDGRRHFEQAVFADGLSEQSLDQLRTLIGEHWKRVTADLVPALEKMIADDDASGKPLHRVRVGMFDYQAPVGPPAAPSVHEKKTAPRKQRRTGET